MNSALSQEVSDAPLVASNTQIPKRKLRYRSQPASFIAGSIVVHVALLAFASETPAALTEAQETPIELVVDVAPEEPQEDLVPLGQLEEKLPVEPSPQIQPVVVPQKEKLAAPNTLQKVATTPEILGVALDAPEQPQSPASFSFNPYAQQNTNHFTKGNPGTRTKPPSPRKSFGVESGDRKASASSAAALRSWYGSIRAKLAAGGLSQYPKRARKLNLTGLVKLLVRIGAAGQLLSVSVQNSSGVPILDQAAIDGVRRVTSLPKPPAGTGKSELLVPIKFSLR